jgi:tryptophan halogenase
MDNTEKNFRTLIVGGGTAGWMAAAYLSKTTNCEITLVESAEVPTVGVGEATIPSLIDFLQHLQIDELEFMRRCQATYKLGIKFDNWVHPEHQYWHPFGLCGGVIDHIDLFHFWVKARRFGMDVGRYSDYSLQALLAACYKVHRPIGGEAVVANYAFHLDANAFAHFLKEFALTRGVRHVIDSIESIERNAEGSIARLKSAAGHDFEADLYIDCTGFRGLLIEETLNDPFLGWEDMLLCDRAVVFSQPPDEQAPSFTRSTAVDSGWIWRIPLQNRIGNGYVFSRRHIDDERAVDQLVNYAGQEDRGDAQVRFLDMRVGRRTAFWKHNCVAIGLASGFIEPLESTGIFLVQRALEELIECFPAALPSPTLARVYNDRMSAVYDETRDFVLLHYILSQRDDTAFWRDSRHVELPDSLRERIQLYEDAALVLENDRNPVFRETNFYFIYAGADRMPAAPSGRAEFSNFSSILQLMNRIRMSNEKIATALPSHKEWLDQLRAKTA